MENEKKSPDKKIEDKKPLDFSPPKVKGVIDRENYSTSFDYEGAILDAQEADESWWT